jgi:hypothetical protein
MASTASLLGLVQGCLPRHAPTRGAEILPRRARVDARVAVRTEGVALAPFTRRWELDLAHRWVRDFRDGSQGLLFVVEEARSGDAEALERGPLTGAWFEVRRFPDGRVLRVDATAPWSGAGPHAAGPGGAIESLDLLWLLLSPRLPAHLRAGEHAEDQISFPSAPLGAPDLRTRATVRWTREGAALRAVGSLIGGAGRSVGRAAMEGDPVRCEGAFDLRYVEPADGDNVAMGAEGTVARDVHTRWGARSVTQAQAWTFRVQDRGESPDAAVRTRVPEAPRTPSMVDDARPLVRGDGTAPSDAAVPIDALPFLLLPYGLSSGDLALLRAELLTETR